MSLPNLHPSDPFWDSYGDRFNNKNNNNMHQRNKKVSGVAWPIIFVLLIIWFIISLI